MEQLVEAFHAFCESIVNLKTIDDTKPIKLFHLDQF